MPWQNSGRIRHICDTRHEIHPEASTKDTQRNSARRSGSNHGCCSRTVLDSGLRSLVKFVRSRCHGCKIFRAILMAKPAPGLAPGERTTVGGAFEVVGADFAGPIRNKRKQNKGKAYFAISACILSRALYLEFLPNMEMETFIIFVKAAFHKDEKLQRFLEQHEIKWKFNLSWAPSWGGQFERLITVIKTAMYKVVGGGNLNWTELTEVL